MINYINKEKGRFNMTFEMGLQIFSIVFLTGVVILIARGLIYNMSEKKSK